MTDETKTEAREIAPIRETVGGGALMPQNFMEVIEVAKMMARANIGVPKHLRDDPGACMAVCMQALRWGMDPFSVATKSYNVNGVIAYEAQLLAAVIISRAPIKTRPKYEFDGEGQTLTCRVTVEMRTGETLEYQSPPMGSITIKNSPLWKTDPQQQLGYYSIRSWARRHAPDAILGVYTPEEAQTIEGEFQEVDKSDPLEDDDAEVTPFEEIEDDMGTDRADSPKDTQEPDDSAVEPEPEPADDATEQAGNGEDDSGAELLEDETPADADAPEEAPKPIKTASDAVRWTNRQLSKATEVEATLALFNSGGAKELGQKFGDQVMLLIKALVATYRDFLKENLDEEKFAARVEGLLEIGDDLDDGKTTMPETEFKKRMDKLGLTI